MIVSSRCSPPTIRPRSPTAKWGFIGGTLVTGAPLRDPARPGGDRGTVRGLARPSSDGLSFTYPAGAVVDRLPVSVPRLHRAHGVVLARGPAAGQLERCLDRSGARLRQGRVLPGHRQRVWVRRHALYAAVLRAARRPDPPGVRPRDGGDSPDGAHDAVVRRRAVARLVRGGGGLVRCLSTPAPSPRCRVVSTAPPSGGRGLSRRG